MPRLSKSIPRYQKHRASGQAVVTLNGKDIYLGPHGSKASKLAYDVAITEWLANGRQLPSSKVEGQRTVVELIAAYNSHMKETYPNYSAFNSEPSRVKPVLKLVKEMYGREAISQFGPLSLKAVREKLITRGQSRSFINQNVRRIVRMFRWGVANELVTPDTLKALEAVEGLRRGRSTAKEGRVVKPVHIADVDATLPHLQPILADVVRLQLLTGCRPSELLNLKPEQIERSKPDLWILRPPRHKNVHRGQDRVIYMGPKAIEILTPYMLRPADSYAFSPQESERRRREERHAKRKTPLSCGNRPGSKAGKAKTKRKIRKCYDADAYRRAVQRAAEKANVPIWHPYQLRHTRATELREKYGIEHTAAVLGHSDLRTSLIYAEASEARAIAIAREVG